MVVVILVVLWAAVLGPRIVRRLRERGPDGSVDSFYHELHLLDRAAPKTVAPANRLETAVGGAAVPGSSGYPSVSSMPGRPSLVLLPPVRSDDGPGVRPPARPAAAAPPAIGVPANRTLAARDRAYRVRQTRRRRRDVLLVLLAVVAVTGLLGTTHSFRFLWDLTILAAVLLVVYVGLAVRAGQMAATARYRQAPVRPSTSARRPVAGSRGARQRYAERYEPAYEAYDADEAYEGADEHGYAAGYGYAGGYGYGYDDQDVGASARSGYPGAWDDDAGFPAARRVAAAGG